MAAGARPVGGAVPVVMREDGVCGERCRAYSGGGRAEIAGCVKGLDGDVVLLAVGQRGQFSGTSGPCRGGVPAEIYAVAREVRLGIRRPSYVYARVARRGNKAPGRGRGYSVLNHQETTSEDAVQAVRV